ncbi:aldehyde dehydrogenase family protein, partial [Mycobacterium kubicae]|uniref:aldehyde dehydrogenase family protein n=1 Tax=Mycobacterium kubicae TaxID=120959 RepID=UPI001F60737B
MLGGPAGVDSGVDTLRQYAELGPLHRGRSLQGNWDATDLMIAEPRGVVAVLTPWNDPVAVA